MKPISSWLASILPIGGTALSSMDCCPTDEAHSGSDHARRHLRRNVANTSDPALEEALAFTPEHSEDLLKLDEALDRLSSSIRAKAASSNALLWS